MIIVALLSLAGWAGYARGQRTNSVRQTWEYRVDNARTNANDAYNRASPGIYIDPRKSQQLLNQRAAEGWELAGVGEWLYYFKRAR